MKEKKWKRKKKKMMHFIDAFHPFVFASFLQRKRITFRLKRSFASFLFGRKKEKKKIVKDFFNQFPNFLCAYHEDMEQAFYKDPASEDKEEIYFLYPGFYAIFIYRIAHFLYEKHVKYTPRMLSEYAHSLTGIDIHPGADILPGCFIDHGTGVVIGETTKVGKNAFIFQGVTLGALSLKEGRKLEGEKRHPSLGDNVTLYAYASVLGGKTIIEDERVIKMGECIKK